MINPYYYIFYRFNLVLNKRGDNQWGTISAISFFTTLYLMIIFGTLFDINQGSSSQDKSLLVVIGLAVFGLNSVLFLDSNRVNRIMESYRHESANKGKIRAFFVLAYIIAPLVWIVF